MPPATIRIDRSASSPAISQPTWPAGCVLAPWPSLRLPWIWPCTIRSAAGLRPLSLTTSTGLPAGNGAAMPWPRRYSITSFAIFLVRRLSILPATPVRWPGCCPPWSGWNRIWPDPVAFLPWPDCAGCRQRNSAGCSPRPLGRHPWSIPGACVSQQRGVCCARLTTISPRSTGPSDSPKPRFSPMSSSKRPACRQVRGDGCLPRRESSPTDVRGLARLPTKSLGRLLGGAGLRPRLRCRSSRRSPMPPVHGTADHARRTIAELRR